MRRLVSPVVNDKHFLELLGRFQRVLARVLALALVLVIVVATIHLLVHMAQAVYPIDPINGNLMEGQLVPLLGELLTLLIAIEVLENITAYLRQHTIQLELVLATALTALARKVIVFDKADIEDPALLIVALGAAIIFLSAGYWMVRKAHHQSNKTHDHSNHH
ncbi:MAG: phosphate-starvation-inducible PsiE family protein [Cyanobacteria bacterium MAG CAR3_bin_5]|nr:phosphate-starvation-inducible PsiE family protein [Cyanobacteria bacterium MAG CAR4_bin_6]MCY4174369.1 phosphate-starvation-inducible PsiE family protein [Cyanobacteria bacterium MAG CAR3_bin_5]MCY4235343.1 phosphate-starvation-inducible PsiE family protein [Cyanobacteria bacterium MAG CAR2_bin_4]MCY4333042.1 phosphate-starvation-inducible PsiE family protein [Cyanobacteria bacterium MAG CAR1_bin_15]